MLVQLLIFAFLNTCSLSDSKKAGGNSPDHAAWDALLQKHVAANGDVDYKGFKKDQAKLDAYLKQLSNTDASSLPENERLAYWINAYNAFTVDLVVQHYPVKSIKDIRNAKTLVAKAVGDKQVWIEKLRYRFNGEELSLYNIENRKLLKELFDPRIHFAINCASYSCPRLWNRAFTAANVQQAMTMLARDFINDTRKNKISRNQAQLSEIFNWYKGDFTRQGALIAYLNTYSQIKLSPNARISFIPYNWNLNE